MAVLGYIAQDPCDVQDDDLMESRRYEGRWAKAKWAETEEEFHRYCTGLAEVEIVDLCVGHPEGVDGHDVLFLADGEPYLGKVIPGGWAGSEVRVEFEEEPGFLTGSSYRDHVRLSSDYCLPPLESDYLYVWFGTDGGSGTGFAYTRTSH